MGRALAEAFPESRESSPRRIVRSVAPLAALLRGAGRGPAADREHAAGDPRRQRGGPEAVLCPRRPSGLSWPATAWESTRRSWPPACWAGQRRRWRAPPGRVHAGGGACRRGRDGGDPRAGPGGGRGRLPGSGRRGGRRSANINSPGQVVIAGHAAAVDRAVEACKRGAPARAVRLPVSAPFHCALMAPARSAWPATCSGWPSASPRFPS